MSVAAITNDYSSVGEQNIRNLSFFFQSQKSEVEHESGPKSTGSVFVSRVTEEIWGLPFLESEGCPMHLLTFLSLKMKR